MIDVLYLHIGAPKTGSSSLQTRLFSVRRKLRSRGVYYPSEAANHYFLASAFHAGPAGLFANRFHGRTSPQALASYHEVNLSAVKKGGLSKDWPAAIFSSESLSMLRPDGIQRLKDFVSTFAKEVRVVCYVRHPAKDAVSRAQQNIKIGIVQWEDFFDPNRLKSAVRFFPVKRCLDDYSQVFGSQNMIIRAYDRSTLIGEDIVTDFLSNLGLPALKRGRVSENRSLTQEAALVANVINKHFPRLENAAPRLPFFLKKIRGRPFHVPSEATKWIERKSISQLDALREYGLDMAACEITPYQEMPSDAEVVKIAERHIATGKFRRMVREINSMLRRSN